nr:DUF5342 family protein [Paenibacillus bovis]
MLHHFQVKPIFEDGRLPGWIFSFYFEQTNYNGKYHPNGSIEWTNRSPMKQHISKIEKHIHNLMIYHIYDVQR